MTTYARLAELDAVRRASKYGTALAKAAQKRQEASRDDPQEAFCAVAEPEDDKTTPAQRSSSRTSVWTVLLIAVNLVFISFLLAIGYHNGQLTQRSLSALEERIGDVSVQVSGVTEGLRKSSGVLEEGLVKARATSAGLEEAVAGLNAGLEDARRGQRENASRFSELKRQIDGVHRRINDLEVLASPAGAPEQP